MAFVWAISPTLGRRVGEWRGTRRHLPLGLLRGGRRHPALHHLPDSAPFHGRAPHACASLSPPCHPYRLASSLSRQLRRNFAAAGFASSAASSPALRTASLCKTTRADRPPSPPRFGHPLLVTPGFAGWRTRPAWPAAPRRGADSVFLFDLACPLLPAGSIDGGTVRGRINLSVGVSGKSKAEMLSLLVQGCIQRARRQLVGCSHRYSLLGAQLDEAMRSSSALDAVPWLQLVATGEGSASSGDALRCAKSVSFDQMLDMRCMHTMHGQSANEGALLGAVMARRASRAMCILPRRSLAASHRINGSLFSCCWLCWRSRDKEEGST